MAGTQWCADLFLAQEKLLVTSPEAADREVESLPGPVSVVADWLAGGELVGQAASLRANELALLATQSAADHKRIEV